MPVCAMLQEVYWQGMFKGFDEVVRVMVKCRDPSKIPT